MKSLQGQNPSNDPVEIHRRLWYYPIAVAIKRLGLDTTLANVAETERGWRASCPKCGGELRLEAVRSRVPHTYEMRGRLRLKCGRCDEEMVYKALGLKRKHLWFRGAAILEGRQTEVNEQNLWECQWCGELGGRDWIREHKKKCVSGPKKQLTSS